MDGHDDDRDTNEKSMLDCVTSMEMSAFGVKSLGDLILLHWDDTIVHAASRTEIIHTFSIG